MRFQHKIGFSLVELSIVLVILGLLVGGILAGQSLIRASELRSVTTDITRFTTGMHAFRDKYFALPGDMPNATSFWGFASGSTGTDNACYAASSTTATCNGTGNLRIDYPIGTGGMGENTRFWQHMALAGLIEGSYPGTDSCTPGTTCPKSRISNAGYGVFYQVSGGSFGENFASESNGNAIVFGGGTGIPRVAVIRPEEAWNIDTKMDDGKADKGIVQTDTFSSACYTGTYPNAVYALATTSIACNLRFSLK